MDRTLRVDIELFSRGGVAILDAIERSGYNTLQHRPALSKWSKLRLIGAAVSSRISDTRQPAPASSLAHQPGMRRQQRRRPHIAPGRQRFATSYAQCARIAREANSSFYLAFFGLRKPKRNALCALYAFNRLVDNISDEPGDLESKRRGLARWRAMLDEAAAWKTGGHPILPALADTISRFEIPTRYFHDLILGAEMDLTIDSYATFDRLAEYCYRVAGTVGLTCTHVFGFSDPKSPDLAERLGLAFQLTNIIRDVRGDYEIGRVYIPQEDFDRFGVPAKDLAGPASERARNASRIRSGSRLAFL